MNNEEQILGTLNQLLEVQRQMLANQQHAIEQQQVALQRQAAHLRLYKIVLFVSGLLVAYLVYTLVQSSPSS